MADIYNTNATGNKGLYTTQNLTPAQQQLQANYDQQQEDENDRGFWSKLGDIAVSAASSYFAPKKPA